MSTVIIYGFNQEGVCSYEAEVHNAWRGAIAVWKALEKKYLPQYRPRYVPASVPDDEVEAWLGYSASRLSSISDPDAMKDVWNLFEAENVSGADKIVLGTTLDNVLVRRENIPKVIEAFEEFDKEHEGETNLKQQADELRDFYDDDEVSAVGWNQTSVNGDDWSNTGEIVRDEDGDEIGGPYNFNTGKKHWWLFDALAAVTEENHE